MSSEKVMKKTNGNINLVSLNIIEESATTIDWLILGSHSLTGMVLSPHNVD